MTPTNPRPLFPSAIPADRDSPPGPWRRWRRLVLAAGLAAVLWLLHMPTQPLRLATGAQYDVLQFDRSTSITIDPRTGERDTEVRLLVKYYAPAHEMAAMRDDARALAPALFPVADSLGLAILLLEPSRPILTRAFPLGVVSYDVRFERDSAGHWAEEP